MKLADMTLDKAEQKKESSMAIEAPKYPCGLNFSMNDDALEKIGMTDMPEVGEEMTLTAIVTVTGVSANDYGDGQKNRSVSLQITSMSLDEGPDDDADTLYGGKK